MASKLTDLDQAMRHKYRVESGGAFVPGVTTIIGITDKPGLKWASSKIAAETAVANSRRKASVVKEHRASLASRKGNQSTAVECRRLAEHGTADEVFVHFCRGEFDRVWKAKADRGSRIHDVAERWTRGETVTVRDDEAGWVDSLENFHKLYEPKFLLTECVVVYDPRHNMSVINGVGLNLPHGGRFDTISELHGEGCDGTYLVDYKTGGEYDYEVALQAIGYWTARLVKFKADGSLAATEALPKLDGCRSVYLRGDGSVKVSDPFEVISTIDAASAFKASRELYEVKTKMENQLKGKE